MELPYCIGFPCCCFRTVSQLRNFSTNAKAVRRGLTVGLAASNEAYANAVDRHKVYDNGKQYFKDSALDNQVKQQTKYPTFEKI